MPAEEFENPLFVQQNFKDFCHLPNSLLRPYGMNFNQISESKWLNSLKKCLLIMETLAHFYCFSFIMSFTVKMMLSDEAQLDYLLRLLSGVNFSIFGSLKFFAIIFNFKEWQNIYETLKEIYPKTHKEKLANRVRKYYWPKWIIIILYFYMIAVSLIVFSPFGKNVMLFLIQLNKVDFSKAQFPYDTIYDIDYSFDHRQPFGYLFTFVIEVLHGHFIIISNILGDILLLCFCLQLCMHFDFLARTLENYTPDTAKDQKFLADFVRKHQKLLKYCLRYKKSIIFFFFLLKFLFMNYSISDDVKRAFGSSVLVLLMSTTGNFCCAAVFCLTQGFGIEFLQFGTFVPTVMGQYFMICYYGQQLIVKVGIL